MKREIENAGLREPEFVLTLNFRKNGVKVKDALTKWRREQPDGPNQTEAARRIILKELGLEEK